MNANGAPRHVIRLALLGELIPLMGNALLSEHEEVLAREHIIARCILDANERQELFEAFLSTCEWISVYFLWRPNLRDEQDNHLIELALAGGAGTIITANKRDFENSDLSFPDLNIFTAGEFLNNKRQRWEH